MIFPSLHPDLYQIKPGSPRSGLKRRKILLYSERIWECPSLGPGSPGSIVEIRWKARSAGAVTGRRPIVRRWIWIWILGSFAGTWQLELTIGICCQSPPRCLYLIVESLQVPFRLLLDFHVLPASYHLQKSIFYFYSEFPGIRSNFPPGGWIKSTGLHTSPPRILQLNHDPPGRPRDV